MCNCGEVVEEGQGVPCSTCHKVLMHEKCAEWWGCFPLCTACDEHATAEYLECLEVLEGKHG